VLLVVVMVALARIATRPRKLADGSAPDSPIGVATEGMKACPQCGMGNLWTERSCSACGTDLKG
jgi:uncharacterized protein (DUF983 family)